MLVLLKTLITILLPLKVRRRLFHPMIVSSSYREEIDLAESVLLMRHDGINLDSEYWAAILRKYGHILDKGLQRCDCETGHSQNFHLLAREALGKITDDKLTKDPSVIWARNKILEYETFQNQVSRYSDSIPFTSTTCTYEQLYDVIRTRRSIRTFDDRMVPKSDIEKIVSVVNWAPASCNRQTVKVYIANSPEIIQKCISTNNGATCLGDFIPCFISFCADLRPYEMPQEMTLPILDAALGIQNCCLVAHSLGIGMTLLNWTHHTDEQATLLRKIMGIPPYFRIIANAVLGYPAQGAPLPARKSEQFTYTFIQDAITS